MNQEQQKRFEAFLMKRINTSSAGYLAALEDALEMFCTITESTTYDNYLKDQKDKPCTSTEQT
jgi:hypothetical protein